MQFPIVIGLHRSRFLGALIVIASLFGAVTIVAWPQPLPVRAGALLVIAIAALFAWRRAVPPCIALRLLGDGAMTVQYTTGGDFLSVEVLPGGFVHPWLAVIRLRDSEGRILAMPIAVDSAKPADFRRLRLFLRWTGRAEGQSDGR